LTIKCVIIEIVENSAIDGSGITVAGDDKLIHAADPEIIQKYLDKLKNCKLDIAKLNKFRSMVGNCKIEYR